MNIQPTVKLAPVPKIKKSKPFVKKTEPLVRVVTVSELFKAAQA
ncbi:MAG TPA: hypothetical protein VFC02_09800 [Anaerolineales bacterium]|nr:hypothetical protein [Anaerolineales bacterium]